MMNGTMITAYLRRCRIDKLIYITEKWFGVPYIWGGNSIAGVDCSGFVCNVLRSIGKIKQHGDYTAHDLWEMFGGTELENIETSITPTRGALAFWFDDDKAVHVAICIDEETAIMAARGSKELWYTDEPEHSTDQSFDDAITLARKANAMVDYVPLDYRDDPVRFVRLF